MFDYDWNEERFIRQAVFKANNRLCAEVLIHKMNIITAVLFGEYSYLY